MLPRSGQWKSCNKKLKDAAQGWAAPEAVQNDTLAEMELLNAPKALIDELKQDQHIEILPDNWPVVCWFVEVCDLLRFSANGRCLGLDLQQVESEANLSKLIVNREHFNGLRVMSQCIAVAMAAR